LIKTSSLATLEIISCAPPDGRPNLIVERTETRRDHIREGVLTLTLDMMNPDPEIGLADADRVGPTLGHRA